MNSLNSPKNLPTNSELLELIKKQDDVIEELSKRLEHRGLEDDGSSDDNEVSEALVANQKILIELRNKLKESIDIMERLQEKNVSLSDEIKQLREGQLGFSPASSSLFEMHNLLENERAEVRRLQDELFESKRLEQKKTNTIANLEQELDKIRTAFTDFQAEMKKKIEVLMKEIRDKSAEQNLALMEKREAEERLVVIEESHETRTAILEDQCKKLQHEVGILTKKKMFLNERIKNLTDEMGVMRQKLIDATFDYYGDDEVKALIKEQKAVIEATRIENSGLKNEIRKLRNAKTMPQRKGKPHQRAVDELIDKYLLKL